ncbi:MAG: fructosamine kinase family protein [Anaerolineae bacterium]|nr:fructosamine kinase family protein [Anaerolineae bacterium]
MLGDWLGAPVRVEAMRPLSGGMVNQVLYVAFDRDPARAVLKVQPDPAEAARRYFPPEYVNLRHLRAHDFPVPEPYFLHEADSAMPFDVLAMEFWDAVNLGHARLTRREMDRLEREMAETLLALHAHHRDTYGAVDADPGNPSWADEFARRVRPRFESIRGKISAHTARQIDAILDRFDVIFADAGPPTLVHGDIWATNIMLEQRADGWHLRGFVDPGALYADVEYELAYLQVFNSAGAAFFEAYTARRPTRAGYPLRRAAYWLNTMIIHVDHFGDAHYRQNTVHLAEQLAAALGL